MINKKHTTLPGMDALPEPLSKEEEASILLSLSTSSQLEARNTLVERNLRLVAYIAKKFENSEVATFDDFFSIGCIGLTKAANTFAIEKNVKFATYAARCIENEMLMYLRKNKKHLAVISLDTPLSIDEEGNDLLISHVVSDPSTKEKFEAYENNSFMADFLTSSINSMSYIDICIILYRLEHITQKEIAKRFGWSQSYISRKERKAFDNLKRLSKDLVKPSNPKILFRFDTCFSIKFFKKYFIDMDKTWNSFLLTHSFRSIQLVQNTKEIIEIRSDSEEIFIFLADFLLYLYA